jgi:hypothetical protein
MFVPHCDAAESLTSHPAAHKPATARSIVRCERWHSSARRGIPTAASLVALSTWERIIRSTSRSVDVSRAEERIARMVAK